MVVVCSFNGVRELILLNQLQDSILIHVFKHSAPLLGAFHRQCWQ